MKVLSVVCARTGSKGLNNKCVQDIQGKMVAEYVVEYSLSLGSGVKTVISTDIKELIDYCAKNDISYISRDPAICDDDSRIDDALADAIEKEGTGYNYCSLLYGNIPTRYISLFRAAADYLEKNGDYDAVVSMQNVEKFHPEWMFEYNESVILPRKETQYRRQSLPQKMIPDGHTFIFRSEKFYKRFKGLQPYDKTLIYSVYGDRIKPLINNELIVDIDTAKDLELARAVISNRFK